MILVFIHLYDISSSQNGILCDIPMSVDGIKSDGQQCQKRNRIDIFDDGLSSRSMTTTAAKGAINAEKMSQFGADNATFMREFGAINSHNSQIFQPPVPHIFSFR